MLFTSTSKRSNSRSVCSTVAAQFSAGIKSASMKVHLPPSLHSSTLSLFPASRSLSTKTGIAPSRAQPRAIAAPIPLAPPVMRTTLSLSCRSTFRRFQLIELCRISAEDLFFYIRRTVPKILLNNLYHLLIAGSEQAHRPIRAEHQPLRTKRVKDYIQIGPEIFFLPVMPVGFRHQA